MKDIELKIIFILAVVGTIFVVFTARPDPSSFVSDKQTDNTYDLFFAYNTIRFPTHAQIVTPNGAENVTIGINLQTNAIDFGVVPGSGSVRKEINLTSRDERTSLVSLKAYGDIKPMITFDQNNFLLAGKKTIALTLNTGSQGIGNYTGEIDVTIQRSKYGILNFLLGY